MSSEYDAVRQAFDSPGAAAKYVANKHPLSRRNRREERAIGHCLQSTAPLIGKQCIDIPCGTFRLARVLLPAGLEITAADYSEAMLDQARQIHAGTGSAAAVTFSRQDVLHTTFADATFDIAVCNRLLHHYSEPQTRIAVLRELARITRDAVIVSFFDSASASNLVRRCKHVTGLKRQRDRYAISRGELATEAHAVGLQPVCFEAVRRFVSPQTYVRLEHRRGGGGAQDAVA